MSRDILRCIRGQQALFAVVDTLVKTFLPYVPEPPQDGLPQSVARGRDRYFGFIKSARQATVLEPAVVRIFEELGIGDSQAAMEALVNHVD